MKTCIAFICLTLIGVLSSCSLTATGYPVAGPAAKQGHIIQARFTYGGGGTGGVRVQMPDGEVCQGRYSTVVGGVMSPEVLAVAGGQSGVASGAVASGHIMGLQTSRAMLAGNRGTIIDFEGYTSGANPMHGFGMAKDNRGSKWKLIW